MKRIVGNILTLAQHLSVVQSDPEQYRPQACPHCGWARLWRHGCYHRKADRSASGELNPVPVLRFICQACVRTCSRLPACLAPRRWYDWAVQQAVWMLLLEGMSLHGCSRVCGLQRRTVGRWRQWLHQRHEAFAFELRSRWPEWGRCADFASFWRQVISELSLAQAMAWLDRDLSVP